MTNLKNTANNLWKIFLISIMTFTISCATEEVEETDTAGIDAEELYYGQKKIDLKNAETSISKGVGYFIKNKNSGKVLDVKNYGNDGVNDVHQYDCHKTSNQQWTLIDFNGNARLESGVGGYLEIDNGGTGLGNDALRNKSLYSKDNRQKFTLIRRANGSSQFYIKNVKSGKVLDVQGYSTKNGGNVYQWDKLSSGNENQLWEFYKVSDY